MDDVTSGFNIGANVSLDPDFNELLGFTEAEVRGLLERYRDLGAFDQDVDAALDVMREWCDGYRFAKGAETTVCDTDMVLYYLKHSVPNRRGPDELVDVNVRIDYGKLRHLLVTGRRLNGNFDLLREVVGAGRADGELRGSFPLERLAQRENFLSLLHYFGLLSIRGVTAGTPRLGVPNQTVRQLTYGYLSDAWDDVGVFAVDLYALEGLLRRMAYDGAWRPVLVHRPRGGVPREGDGALRGGVRPGGVTARGGAAPPAAVRCGRPRALRRDVERRPAEHPAADAGFEPELVGGPCPGTKRAYRPETGGPPA